MRTNRTRWERLMERHVPNWLVIVSMLAALVLVLLLAGCSKYRLTPARIVKETPDGARQRIIGQGYAGPEPPKELALGDIVLNGMSVGKATSTGMKGRTSMVALYLLGGGAALSGVVLLGLGWIGRRLALALAIGGGAVIAGTYALESYPILSLVALAALLAAGGYAVWQSYRGHSARTVTGAVVPAIDALPDVIELELARAGVIQAGLAGRLVEALKDTIATRAGARAKAVKAEVQRVKAGSA